MNYAALSSKRFVVPIKKVNFRTACFTISFV
jgi:hypothetical protein